MINLINGDCLKELENLQTESVDLVLTDPPYGTTACKWDTCIHFELMWKLLKRITKKNGAIILFGSQPFTSALVMSNPEMFKYEWIWEKSVAFGFVHAKNQPMKKHENILVFSKSPMGHKSILGDRRMRYEPFGVSESGKKIVPRKPITLGQRPNQEGREYMSMTGFPTSILKFNNDRGLHPTQKPVELMEYLIKTYTTEGETVLDFTMGSGTTGVACKKLGRNFIGIEIDKSYYNIAKQRIEDAK